MTGSTTLDALAVVAFGTVTVLALIRLVRERSSGRNRFLDDGFHAVMGLAMTAMFWPGAGRTGAAWVAVVGLLVVWPLLVLGLAARRPDRTGGAGVGGGRLSLGHTGYWLTCAVLMVVAIGAGHSAVGGAGASGGSMASMPGMAGPGMAGPAGPAAAGIGASGLGPAFQTVADWPIWPLVGVGFLIYAGLILLGRRRPLIERSCAAVMAAGMAMMALSL